MLPPRLNENGLLRLCHDRLVGTLLKKQTIDAVAQIAVQRQTTGIHNL